MWTWVDPLHQPFAAMSVTGFRRSVRAVTSPSWISAVVAIGSNSNPRNASNATDPTGSSRRKLPALVEQVVSGPADPGVLAGRGVEAAVGGGQVDARGDFRSGRVIQGADGEHADRPLPAAARDLDPHLLAAVGLEQLELRQAVFVRDVGDPLSVGRPARVEGVVFEEGHLVGRAAVRGLHVEVLVLIRGAGGGGVDEPLSVDRDIGPGAVERLLLQHGGRLIESLREKRRPDHVPGTERHFVVGDEQELA